MQALQKRIETLTRRWSLTVEETKETETSILVFGKRANQPIVLKVLRAAGDEWHSGEVLKAFNGNGSVRVYEHTDGAVLLERVMTGDPLANLVLSDRDDEATEILAGVIQTMGSPAPPARSVTVEEWARGFEHYLASSDNRIPRALVYKARECYLQLSASQSKRRLLHGDLHHDNILFDAARGWLAIDPKGVVGETEYEIGAALRNPVGRPDLFTQPDTIRRRIERFAETLHLDAGRILRWAFAQAVLSAIWTWEDGFDIDNMDPVLELARVISVNSGFE
jgi:streptomycin 6-kinase